MELLTESDRLMTSTEGDDYLRQHQGFLAKRRVRGDGPAFLRVGRSVRYRRGDIDAWLDANRRTSTSTDAPSEAHGA